MNSRCNVYVCVCVSLCWKQVVAAFLALFFHPLLLFALRLSVRLGAPPAGDTRVHARAAAGTTGASMQHTSRPAPGQGPEGEKMGRTQLGPGLHDGACPLSVSRVFFFFVLFPCLFPPRPRQSQPGEQVVRSVEARSSFAIRRASPLSIAWVWVIIQRINK